MLNTFAINLFIYLIFIIHSLFRIGIAFLDYYADKYNVSTQAMEIFLQKLRFPLTIYRFNQITYIFSEDEKKEIQTASVGTRNLLIATYGVVILLGILFNIYDITHTSGIEQLLSGLWLLLKLLTIIVLRTWRFGHKLQEIEKQVQHNALDVAQITETK